MESQNWGRSPNQDQPVRPRVYQHHFTQNSPLPGSLMTSSFEDTLRQSTTLTGQVSVARMITVNSDDLLLEDVGGYYTIDTNESVIRLVSPLDPHAPKSFLSVRKNNGAIYISGEGSHVVVQQNWGTIDVNGLNHNIFVIDRSVQGTTRKRSGYNVRLNGAELFNVMAQPLPTSPTTFHDHRPQPTFGRPEPWQMEEPPRPNPQPADLSEPVFFPHEVAVRHDEPIFNHGYRASPIVVQTEPTPVGVIGPPPIHPERGIPPRNLLDNIVGGAFNFLEGILQGLSNNNNGEVHRVAILPTNSPGIEKVTTNATTRGVPAVCPICHDEVLKGGAGSSFVDCLDCFHTDCIDSWIRTGKDSCPVCRNQITVHNAVI